MLNDTYTLVYLITNFFSIAILHKFMQAFFDKRKSNLFVSSLSYIAYVIITSVLYIMVDVPILTLISNWILIFLITLNYESKIQKKLLIATYILLFMAIVEVAVSVVTGYFHFSQFSEGSYNNCIGLISAKLVTYMVSLLSNHFKSIKMNKTVMKREWAYSIFIPILTLALEIIIIQATNISQGMVLASLAFVLILNIISFYLYDSLSKSYIEHEKLVLLQSENQIYSKQCEMMQATTENLQSFRHDLNNQFSMIAEMIDKKEYEMARNHISTLANVTNNNIVYSTTGNLTIDGIINYKLQFAADKHIKVNTEIAVPSDLDMDITDIVAIVGNILDNAIQAVEECPQEERWIFVKVVFSQDRLIIQAINPYRNEIEYQNGEIISSKKNKDGHGFGLKNVETAVDKYNGFMEISTDNHLFKIDILLYLVE